MRPSPFLLPSEPLRFRKMTSSGTIDFSQYEAAKQVVAVLDISQQGLLTMVGDDALDLLHRLSTQDLASLAVGEGAATILTTDKGRILDSIVVQRYPDHVLLQISPGNQSRVLEWFDKYTIMEDSVASDATSLHGQLLVFGPNAAGTIARSVPVASDLALYHHAQTNMAGVPVSVSRVEAPVGKGFHILMKPGHLEAVRQTLVDTGALPINQDTFEVIRVEAGQPGFESEFDDRFNPHEVGLGDHISYTKGCYIGQEVIARLDTYDKVQRHLRGLRLLTGNPVNVESELLVNGKVIGVVTSTALSPAFGNIALAFLKKASSGPGTRLTTDTGTTIEVIALPFS